MYRLCLCILLCLELDSAAAAPADSSRPPGEFAEAQDWFGRFLAPVTGAAVPPVPFAFTYDGQPSAALLPVSIEAAPVDKPCAPSSPPMRLAGGAIEIDIYHARVRLRGAVDEASLRTVLTALRSLA